MKQARDSANSAANTADKCSGLDWYRRGRAEG